MPERRTERIKGATTARLSPGPLPKRMIPLPLSLKICHVLHLRKGRAVVGASRQTPALKPKVQQTEGDETRQWGRPLPREESTPPRRTARAAC